MDLSRGWTPKMALSIDAIDTLNAKQSFLGGALRI
jgi:hypothetical protein